MGSHLLGKLQTTTFILFLIYLVGGKYFAQELVVEASIYDKEDKEKKEHNFNDIEVQTYFQPHLSCWLFSVNDDIRILYAISF